jgi:hypothetical protein
MGVLVKRKANEQTEAEAVKTVHRKLVNRGFFVRKLADRSTKGIPDTFIAKYGRGCFIEFKFHDNTTTRYGKTWEETNPTIVHPKVFTYYFMLGPQLQTLCELQEKFQAKYIIIVKIGHGSYRMYEFEPKDVREYLLGEEDAEIPTPTNIASLEEWSGNPF